MAKNNNLVKGKIPVILNCDTGIDDAVAIMMAVKSNKLDIRLIVTDVGNVDSKQAAKNTLNILELIDAPNIPVCAGDGQYFKKVRPKVAVHGNGGLGTFHFDENARRLTKGDAIDKMYETLMKSEQKITIISISPLTNLAKLFTKYPDSVKKIERLVIMSGTIEELKPDVAPYPEFNVATDPEAGEVVFNANVRIDVVPMEMGHTAYLTWQDVFKTKLTNYTGWIFEQIFRGYKDRHVKNGIATHDGCAIAYVTDPSIFEIKPVHAEVKYFDSIDSGVLTMDFKQEPNIITCTKVNVKKFIKLYFKYLKRCQ